MISRNFDEHVAILATEAPSALVLDWWRRLDRTIDAYFVGLDERRPAAPRDELRIASDVRLGPWVADRVEKLRLERNRIAHEADLNLSREDAIRFARDAFSVLGIIMRCIP
jgi:hypothetical protein